MGYLSQPTTQNNNNISYDDNGDYDDDNDGDDNGGDGSSIICSSVNSSSVSSISVNSISISRTFRWHYVQRLLYNDKIVIKINVL